MLFGRGLKRLWASVYQPWGIGGGARAERGLISSEDSPRSAVLRMAKKYPHLLPADSSVETFSAWHVAQGNQRDTKLWPDLTDLHQDICTLAGWDDPDPIVTPLVTKAHAQMDLIRLLRSGEPVASQTVLTARWRVVDSTVSKWVDEWEGRGLVSRVSRVSGRQRRVKSIILGGSTSKHTHAVQWARHMQEAKVEEANIPWPELPRRRAA